MRKFNNKTVVFAGVLVAMNIVLERVFGIMIGDTLRISFGATPIYLAGLWFGPLVGGVVGFLADTTGCILQGFALNPFISLSNILYGVLAGVFKHYVFHDKMNLWKVGSVVTLNGIVGSLGLTTLGLHIYYGTPWAALYATRVVQTIGLVIGNTLLVTLLYKSPITQIINKECTVQKISR